MLTHQVEDYHKLSRQLPRTLDKTTLEEFMKKAVLLFLLVSLCCPKLFSEEKASDSIFGFKIGMTSQEAMKVQKLDIFYDEKCTEVKNGLTTIFLGDVIFHVTLSFEKNKVVAIYGKFQSNKFEIVSKAMVEKFGQPVDSKNEEIKTKIGASYMQTNTNWALKSGNSISLSRYSGNINEGSILLSSPENIKSILKEEEESVSKIRNGL